MRFRSLWAKLAFVMLTAVLLSGCTQASASTPGEQTAQEKYGLEEFVVVLIPGEDDPKSLQIRDTFAADMSAVIGLPVRTYRATDYNAAVEAMRTNQAQLAMLGPFSYVMARQRANAECVAIRSVNGTDFGYYSQIIVRADSDIETLADLQGKRFAFVDPGSTSGNLIPTDCIIKELPDLNLTFDGLHADGVFFKSAMFSGNHPNALQAVIKGDVDAAAVASSTYENEISKGNANAGDLRVIFTSPMIPGSPMAIKKDINLELKEKVVDFLLTYDNVDYFGGPESKSRYWKVDDKFYDYLEDIQIKYNLVDK